MLYVRAFPLLLAVLMTLPVFGAAALQAPAPTVVLPLDKTTVAADLPGPRTNGPAGINLPFVVEDRKSTRLNSSH